MTATATLQIERAEGFAKVAKTAQHSLTMVVPVVFLANALDSVVQSLSPDWLDSLSPENAKEVKTSLQELHRTLVSFLKREPGKRLYFCDRLFERIHERTEDLYDVIESLVLRDHPDFRAIVSNAASSVGIR
jgi:hypothetical protein